ncbi:MAG: hypothetical protein RL059_3 [Bacteroidota bacterium]|jgi:hypothetical protein
MTTTNTNPSKYSWKTVTIYIVLIGLIIYLLVQLSNAKKGHSSELYQLQIQIAKQSEAQNKLKMELDNSQKELGEYLPYKAIIRSASLRDSIYSLLPFKFGESAMIMPDSTPVVINSISIIGNATDYSIKYVVRTKKGEYLQISPSELRK